MHTRWTDQLSDYLDGALAADARNALETHLAACPACATALVEMKEVVHRARSLGEVPPTRDLWPDIEKALSPLPNEAETEVIPLPTRHARHAGARVRPAGFYLTRRQLAAAAAVVALMSAAATWALGPGIAVRNVGHPLAAPAPSVVSQAADVHGPPPALADELAHLEAALKAAGNRLDPTTVRILEKNLDVIDRAIQDSRRALATDPGNPFLREHLNDAYRQKAAYLKEATSIAGWSG